MTYLPCNLQLALVAMGSIICVSIPNGFLGLYYIANFKFDMNCNLSFKSIVFSVHMFDLDART